jgi:hypothetical protein
MILQVVTSSLDHRCVVFEAEVCVGVDVSVYRSRRMGSGEGRSGYAYVVVAFV